MNKLEDVIMNEFSEQGLSSEYLRTFAKAEEAKKELEKGLDENQKRLLRVYDDLCSECETVMQEELVKFCLDFLNMF